MTDIRFRVELNSQTFRISYSSSWPSTSIKTDFGLRVYTLADGGAGSRVSLHGIGNPASLHLRPAQPRLEMMLGIPSSHL
jgi:hypothetical protein